MDCDLSEIQNRELLRNMWQQTEDINRKREISEQLFKLEETRLENLYQGDIMSRNAGFGKNPVTPSHGESLADQSFQSFKSKEVRDSMSPTHDIKFHSLALNQPNNSGWNVQSSSEVSPDGRAFRSDTVATTGGVEQINGGTAEFQGRNEQRSSGSHVGDDKNFVKKSAESSNTHLHENVVVGDEKSGRTEMKMTSSSTTSSSKVVSSSSATDYGNDAENEYIMNDDHHQNLREFNLSSEKQKQQHLHQLHDERINQQRNEQFSNEYQTNRHEKSTSQYVDEQNLQEKTRRVVELDKSSPEYQKHVQYLMSQEGEIISNTVQYPKPNVKMITTVKRLPDGTMVKNKRYETEASAAEAAEYRKTTSNSEQSSTQRKTDSRLYDEQNTKQINKTVDDAYKYVDDVDIMQRKDRLNRQMEQLHNVANEGVTKSFKSVKESSQHFSTQSRSHATAEYEDQTSADKHNRNITKGKDFSTEGFPSVKPNIPTQEFPSDHPHSSRRPEEQYHSSNQSKNEKYQTEKNVLQTNQANDIYNPKFSPDGEVVVVSKQSQKTMTHKTNAERVLETEIIVNDDYPKTAKISQRLTQPDTDYSTPSVNEPGTLRESSLSEQSHLAHYANIKPDFTSHGFPSVRSDKPTQQFSSDRPRTELSERIVETKITSDKSYSTPKKSDFSTHGFPSVRSPTKSQDLSMQGYPKSNSVSPQYKTVKTTTRTPVVSNASVKVVQKEKETDAAHRAFAASLRSDSPVDQLRRDSFPDHHRQTPRSSVSSARTFRRDNREGSHDSTAQSETSRYSSGTVTRQSPSKTVGKTVVTKHTTVKSRNLNGSNETIDLTSQRSTKSPSPMKAGRTTTVRTTVTKPKTTEVPKPDNLFNKLAENKSINEPLTIKKSHLSSNATNLHTNGVIEEPCIKKNFYKLGPSEKLSTKTDDQTAQSSSKPQQSKEMSALVSIMLDTIKEPAIPEKKQTFTENINKQITQLHTHENPTMSERSSHLPAQTSNKTHPHLKNQQPIMENIKDKNDEHNSETRRQSDYEIVIETVNKNNKSTHPVKEQSPERRTVVRDSDRKHITTNIEINNFENEFNTKDKKSNSHVYDNKVTIPSSDSSNTLKDENVLFINKESIQLDNRHSISPNKDIRSTIPRNVSPTKSRESSPLKSQVDIVESEQYINVNSPNTNHFECATDSPKILTTQHITKKSKEKTNSIKKSDDNKKNETSEVNIKIKEIPKLKIQPEENKPNGSPHNKFNVTHEFIVTEKIQQQKESPDGSLISKNVEQTPMSPTYLKKGVSPRETFEDRCRHILGMEQDGNTQGNYKKVPEKEDGPVQQDNSVAPNLLQVTIEDCDDDDNNDSLYYAEKTKVTINKDLEDQQKGTDHTKAKYKNIEIIDKDNIEQKKTEQKSNFIAEQNIEFNKLKKSENKFKNNVTLTSAPKLLNENKKPISKSVQQNNTQQTQKMTKIVVEDKKVSSSKQKLSEKPTHFVQDKSPIRKSNKKERDVEEVSIKHRLRGATKNIERKDDIDAKSSPETSPTRLTERRRSSNISVHTEIIIDHAGPKSPSQEKEISSPSKHSPNKPNQKKPVTQRKESAPVNSVSNKDKNTKMARSTSENIIKIMEKQAQQKETTSLKPERRPNKCFSTKTINISANDVVINKNESEGVIIDIQHAKSSREPSPNKIVPIPVPDYVDTGSPRFPDVVQEPDDQPRRKPVVTNIPILEEETNEYTGCQISEVSIDRMSEISDEMLTTPTVEAPQSLEYTSINKPDDDFQLTVVEKVSKFAQSAEDVVKPKLSVPFRREFDGETKVAENDECLLSVNEKVSKFLKTAEEITKPITPVRDIQRPNFEELDEELRKDDCVLSVSEKVDKFLHTAEKLKPTDAQKAPELVARMERQMSNQNEQESSDHNEDVETSVSDESVIILKSVRGNSIEKHENFNLEIKSQNNKVLIENIPDEAVPPMTKSHSTAIEMKRQKDILNRPSVFQTKTTNKKETRKHSPELSKTYSKSTGNEYINTNRKKSSDISIGKVTKNHDKFVEQDNNDNYNKMNNEKHIIKKNDDIKKDLSHSHSPTRSNSKHSVAQITERTEKHISHKSTTALKSSEPIVDSNNIKKQTNLTTGRLRDSSSESIAARRNIFEKNAPESPTKTSRRPSYMDHTKSSLEHTRRDSLEINKSNYSRKVSTEDDVYYERRPNSAVKFDVPHYLDKDDMDVSENINIEEIFDLLLLEELLEKVTSYELRRRIRAQIRLVKKQVLDKDSIEKTSYKSFSTHSSKKHQEETDSYTDVKHFDNTSISLGDHFKYRPSYEETLEINEDKIIKQSDRSHSPLAKTISSSMKEVRRDSGTLSSASKYYIRGEHSDISSKQIEERSDYEDKRVQRQRSRSPEVIINSKSKPVSPDRSSCKQSQNPENRRELFSAKSTKTSEAHERKTINNKTGDQSPIWTERKNILKSPNKDKKPPVSVVSRAHIDAKSNLNSSVVQRKKLEEDSIISSYGIGPTDENGLPLFGIRALKTKKDPQPGETKEKITKYVVEENVYSENNRTPIVERKEFIYSTDADELEKIKKEVRNERRTSKEKTSRTSEESDEKFLRNESKASTPCMDEFMTSSSKYVRRGSVKEMSEKFVRKESSQSMTEKTNKYPKAGLIFRTNSRSGSNDEIYDNCSEMTKTEHHQTKKSTRVANESESETESMKVESGSNKSSSKTTRSFLNTTGESRTVTGMDDVLQRMRNADNVVVDGDTPEDQEARALFNKFLGASVIMSGVENILPMSKTETTKTYVYSNNDRSPAGKIKTTRVTTKTTRSGSSSTPVSQTTCSIEESFDEISLKKLLEKSTSYEERRKIRARLRDLMAERGEKTNSKASEKATPAHEADETESSASEYEEIIEEVTDYSEEEEEKVEENKDKLHNKTTTKVTDIKKTSSTENETSHSKQTKDAKEAIKTTATKVESKTENTSVDGKSLSEKQPIVESSDKNKAGKTVSGESLMPLLQDLLHSNMLQAKTAVQNSNTTSVNKSYQTDTNKKAINPKTNCSENKMFSVKNQTTTNRHSKDLQDIVVTVTETAPTPTAIPARTTTNNQAQVNRLSVPQKEDSGTESGEDLRLFAAGLREKLDAQSDKNLIEEVTSALSRLECSLKEGTEIPVDGNKRKSLLALVERLQVGLTSPEKLAELANVMADMDAAELQCNDTSSPENEAQRTSRQRFAKRRCRNSRHTVGVSREELEDARRHMEQMIILDSKSNCTTPDSGLNAITPPHFLALEKNSSSGNIAQPQQSNLLRPTQFMSTIDVKSSTNNLILDPKQENVRKNRRPLSGDFTVSFQPSADMDYNYEHNALRFSDIESNNRFSPDSDFRTSCATSKRQMMKRANTMDLTKTKKYQPELDTDSDMDDRSGIAWALKRGVQVNVKKKVRNVLPPFEPKTENDHKFLAFINKQNEKPGLAWAGNKSVSNWTNKFGNIKNNFEVGISSSATSGKPPQVPGHMHQNISKNYWTKQTAPYNSQNVNYHLQRNQHEAIERQRRIELERQRLEVERLEHQRFENDRQRLEQQRFAKEQLEKERLERERFARECYERECIEKERLERELMERQRLENEILATAQKNALSQPLPLNQFIHAPQSVFRPIENNTRIYKPLAQHPNVVNTWQPSTIRKTDSQTPQFLLAKHSISTPYLNSPSPTGSSPIGLPWLSKPSVDKSDFKNKASMFEERSRNDEVNPVYVQRNNSLRAPKLIRQQVEERRKRPSLPNAADPYMDLTSPYTQIPPPTNLSFKYDDFAPRNNYKSVPCLPTAVNSTISPYGRTREDSLTNPAAVPLVLTSANPHFSPQTNSALFADYTSPLGSSSASPAMLNFSTNDYTDDDLDSVNMTEYRVESKVMAKPQYQTAVTTSRRTNHMSDDEIYIKNTPAAKSLLHTMKNLNNSKRTKSNASAGSTNSTKTCLSPDVHAPLPEPVLSQINNMEIKRQPLEKQNAVYSSVPALIEQSKLHDINNKTAQLSRASGTHKPNKIAETDFSKSTQVFASEKSTQYVGDTQSSYVVSYPSEESLNSLSLDSSHYPKPLQTTMNLKRQRKQSENSTTSSHNNFPSPNTNWTANPIAEANSSTHETLNNKKYEAIQRKSGQIKPNIGPKPQTTNMNNKENESKPKIKTQQEPSKQKVLEKPQTVQQQTKVAPAVYYNNVKIPPFSNNLENLNDRKYSVDGVATTNRVQNHIFTKQLSLSSKPQEQEITEKRRKSLGNVLHLQKRNSIYSETQTEYKSSAPADTPDIVKSSLPKDDTMPILKKFGPPQRHHYVPNAYQSPLSTSAAKTNKVATYTSTNKTIVRREETLTTAKPTIKKAAGSPEPTEEYIPHNIVFNNISAFTSLSRRKDEERTSFDGQQLPRINRLSKSDSWNQILQQQQQPAVISSSPKFNNMSNELRRSKSGHSLAVPKMYEAGLAKEEVTEKQKTVAAYFAGSKSPNDEIISKTKIQQISSKKSAINRTKTNEKVSASRKSLTAMSSCSATHSSTINGGELCRSATMPHIAHLSLLDETNVEDAFEQLMSDKQQTTTDKSEAKTNDGSVLTTTTTKVTTRTVTDSGKKPISPFNKFRQLDRENSQQTSKSTPSTPTTPKASAGLPSGSGVIFKFTDPALNARAATVKEQLLQWCQLKTQEYENIQITNFSTSWTDGLAFCALIHHFLPDAFDYSQLTAKNRRHNFQLAFDVADEKAGIAPLLDVDDMVMMKRPDWKCVFVYVQSIYRRFRNCQ